MKISRKVSIIAAITIVAGGATVTALELTDTTHIFNKPDEQVITTAGEEPNNNEHPSTAGNNKVFPEKNSHQSNHTISGAHDSEGKTPTSTPTSQWITSKSGVITVKQPTANTTIYNGYSLIGLAKSDTVNFRLIDDNIGVISRGTLSVVDGKFSGKLNFKTSASSGRLDIFTSDANGRELNEVQIIVSFK